MQGTAKNTTCVFHEICVVMSMGCHVLVSIDFDVWKPLTKLMAYPTLSTHMGRSTKRRTSRIYACKCSHRTPRLGGNRGAQGPGLATTQRHKRDSRHCVTMSVFRTPRHLHGAEHLSYTRPATIRGTCLAKASRWDTDSTRRHARSGSATLQQRKLRPASRGSRSTTGGCSTGRGGKRELSARGPHAVRPLPACVPNTRGTCRVLCGRCQ